MVMQAFRNLKLKTKMIVLFCLIIIISMGTFTVINYGISVDNYRRLLIDNAVEILRKYNSVVDKFYIDLEEAIDRLSYDSDMFDILLEFDSDSAYSYMESNNKIMSVFTRYFRLDEIETIILTGENYVFGDGQWVLKQWNKSPLKQRIKDNKGGFLWVPTYQFDQMLQLKYLEEIDYEYKFMFACAKELTIFRNVDTGVEHLSDSIEKPILLVNYQNTIFDTVFNSKVPIDTTQYLIADDGGNIIYKNKSYEIEKSDVARIVSMFESQDSGVLERVYLKDHEYIVCYDRSKVNGWITVAFIDQTMINERIRKELYLFTILFPIFIMIAGSLLVAIITNHINKPLQLLMRTFDETGEGALGKTVEVKGTSDVDELLHKFNNMSLRIHKLIKENYEIKLHEKESQIMALNFQLQPHFLYNTLNLINCLIIDDNRSEANKVMKKLSLMLRYTANVDKKLSSLHDELRWIKDYLYIIKLRFQDKIKIKIRVDEALSHKNFELPKLIMQPFIENAFIHGFKKITKQWELTLSIENKDDHCLCMIKDNGVGISKDTLERIFEKMNIGIANVYNRMLLTYGRSDLIHIDSVVGEGTTIMLIVPYQNH